MADFLRLSFVCIIHAALLCAPAYAQSQNINSGCGTNIGNLNHSNVTINIDCASQYSRALSFTYSRLFGAMEVPLLMEIVPTGDFEPDDLAEYRNFSPHLRTPNKEYPDLVHKRLVRFRNAYPYRGASPIQSAFWNAISGDMEIAEQIAWRATAGRQLDRLCFFASSTIDSSLYNRDILKNHLLNRPDSYCDEIFGVNNNRIGFTFLVIENVSSEPVDDLRIFYRENYSTNPVSESDYKFSEFGNTEYKEYLEREINAAPRDGESVPNLVKKYGHARETEISLADAPQSFQYISRLEPKKKLIALLNIYVSNKNNLPASYLYGTFDYEEATFSIRGTSYRTSIRRPSKDRAARVKVPFGWFQQ
jgi:hypothetical protein